MTYTLRPGGPDDCALLAPIEIKADERYEDTHLAGLGTNEGFPLDAAIRYQERGHLYMAEVAGEPVGFIGWHHEDDPDYVGIAQVSVLQQFGRQGIGAALMNAAINYAKQKQAKAVTLTTQLNIEWNEPWYRAMGFSVVAPEDFTPWMLECQVDQEAAGVPWDERVWMILPLVDGNC